MSDWPYRLAIRSIDISHRRRIGPTPRTVITGIGEQLAGLGATSPWIEHRCRGLVSKQLGRALEDGEHALVHRSEKEGSAAHPIGEGRTIQIDALSSIDLGLAV